MVKKLFLLWIRSLIVQSFSFSPRSFMSLIVEKIYILDVIIFYKCERLIVPRNFSTLLFLRFSFRFGR